MFTRGTVPHTPVSEVSSSPEWTKGSWTGAPKVEMEQKKSCRGFPIDCPSSYWSPFTESRPTEEQEEVNSSGFSNVILFSF